MLRSFDDWRSAGPHETTASVGDDADPRCDEPGCDEPWAWEAKVDGDEVRLCWQHMSVQLLRAKEWRGRR